MNKIKIFLCLVFSFNSYANLDTYEVNLWVDKIAKKVHYEKRPLTKVVLHELAAGPNHWASLSIDMFYTYDPLIEKLSEDYPEYEFHKVISNTATKKATLKIPVLNTSIEVKVLNQMQGPFFNYSLFLTKEQYEKVLDEMRNGRDIVSISTINLAYVPQLKLVETVELEKNTCKDLLKEGNDLLNFSQNYLVLKNKLLAKSYKYKETRETLINSILENCFNSSIFNKRIYSFHDLTSQRVELLTNFKGPKGVTFKSSANEVLTQMKFIFKQEVISNE